MFEDKIDADKTERTGERFGFIWKLLLITAVFGSLLLTYVVFFQPSAIPLSSFRQDEENGLTLTGKDGLYFVELPRMKINVQSDNHTFIETRIALELSQASAKRDIQAVLPRITDAVNGYLREMSLSELQESGSLYKVKEALLERINFLIAPAHITDVLFKELFIGQSR